MPTEDNKYWLQINDITKFDAINSKIALGSDTQKWKEIIINATENDAKSKFDLFGTNITYKNTPCPPPPPPPSPVVISENINESN